MRACVGGKQDAEAPEKGAILVPVHLRSQQAARRADVTDIRDAIAAGESAQALHQNGYPILAQRALHFSVEINRWVQAPASAIIDEPDLWQESQ